jgi:hypothetical protein
MKRLLGRVIPEFSFEQLLAIAEPLPLVDSEGNLEWQPTKLVVKGIV